MNLTWHIARKDIHRFWGPLALLCAVTVLRLAVGMSLLVANEPDPVWFGHMAVYANVLWGIGLFVTYMLVAAVIQEDSVASAAFWQTRPISGPRLLAAKALGIILMFGLLPVLLSLPWWLGCGFGWAEISRAAAETFAVQMGVALLALPWAVVTGHYGRFLLWTVVALVAWVTVALLLVEHSIASREYASEWAEATRMLVVLLVAAVGCLGVAVHQFATRRTWGSIVLIAATGLLMAGVGRWWSWDGLAFWSPRAQAPTGVAKDVRISLDNAYAFVGYPSPEGNSVAEVGLLADSVPSHSILTTLYSEQNLRWADGTVTSQARFNPWGMSAPTSTKDAYYLLRMAPEPRDPDWMRYAMRHNLFRLPDFDPRKGKYFVYYNMVLPPAAMRKLGAGKPEYDGTFWFRLLRPEVVGEGEIRVGSEFSKGSNHARIASVKNDESKHVLWISLIEHSPAHMLYDLLSSKGLVSWNWSPAYGIVNRQRTHTSDGLNETRDHALIANVDIVLRIEGFRGHNRWDPSTHRWQVEKESLDGSTLVEVDFPEVQTFSLPIKIDQLAFHSGIPFDPKGSPIGSITVTGEANKPGTLDLAPGENLVNALRAAGGVSDRADLSAVVLNRVNSGGAPSRTVVNVEAYLEGTTAPETIPILQPGDAVDVPAETSGQSP